MKIDAKRMALYIINENTLVNGVARLIIQGMTVEQIATQMGEIVNSMHENLQIGLKKRDELTYNLLSIIFIERRTDNLFKKIPLVSR